MSTIKKTIYSAGIIGLVSLLVACLPPALFPFGIIYEVANEPVQINVTVANSPGSVNCTNTKTSTQISLTKDSGDVWMGTFGGAELELGENSIQCKASNNNGSTSQTVGTIHIIENTPPTLVTFANVTVYDDNGNTAINEPLVDTDQSSHLDGAEYVLDATSDELPPELSIDINNGNLTGTITVGSTTVIDNVVLEATTVAGSDTSAGTTVTIESGTAP